ncbi:hypothetical protein JTF19_06240 [Enterobacteriaceae bacterium RIT814]|nr:hypothetical protein [Enterobacteriaceae bacterium RIT 814]
MPKLLLFFNDVLTFREISTMLQLCATVLIVTGLASLKMNGLLTTGYLKKEVAGGG